MRRRPRDIEDPKLKQAACQKARIIATLLCMNLCVGVVGCAGENQAPVLSFISDQSVPLGTSLVLTLSGSDPDGDALKFTASGLPDGAELQRSSATEALLTWNPLASDTEPGGKTYEIQIQIDDGRGGTASQAFSVVVFSELGAPQFELPGGIVVNLATDDDIAFVVGVKDDDSVAVTLAMEEGPEGALLQAADAKTAYFYWKPSAEQRKRVVHRAVFAAQDESHGVVRSVLTLVLLNAEADVGCGGTPPTIQHQPSGDTVVTATALPLLASVVDGESAISKVVVEWRRGTLSEATLPKTTALTPPDSGYDFTGDLDLADLNPLGELVHYRVVAVDNDDPTGTECDRTARSPKSGWHTVAVYPDTGGTHTCLDDASEPDGDAATAPSLVSGAYFGRRMCGADVDYLTVDTSPQSVVVAQVIADPSHGDLEVSLLDGAGTVVDTDSSAQTTRTVTSPVDAVGPFTLAVSGQGATVAMSYSIILSATDAPCGVDANEPNDSTTGATIDVPVGPTLGLTICAGDSDWFVFQVSAEETLTVSAVFEHAFGDLDVDLVDADGTTVLATSSGENSTETVTFSPDGASQTVYVRVYGHDGGANSYELVVGREFATCDDDIFAPNGSPGQSMMLFQGVYQNLIACPGADDWFAMEVNGGETVDILVDSSASPGGSSTIEVALYQDPTGTPLITVQADQDGITYASLVAPAAGTIFYTVATTASADVDYHVLQQLSLPAGPCSDDRFEPNDTVETASFVSEGVHTSLSLCGSDGPDEDADYFLVDLPPFSTLFVITGHETEMGYTDVTVIDPNGTEVAKVLDDGPGVDLSVLAELPGTYRIEVTGFDVIDVLPYDFAVLVD